MIVIIIIFSALSLLKTTVNGLTIQPVKVLRIKNAK